ncbi:MAG: aminotransferase class V-fold PLP-dependent enzyme [Clostridia bacterium]|nr:aminotransferase class V-fold PLP-dependent enzyme [Clostridia bacterium]
MIYFDNAATSGVKPKSVINAVNTALSQYSVNPGRGGYELSGKCNEIIYNCRKEVASFFGAKDTTSVIFTQNCTQAINYVLKGVLKPSDHIIVSSLEHNAVMRPLYELSKTGVSVDAAEVIFGDIDATARAFANLIKPNTKMIFCTHASNVLGNVLPIKKIGEICKEKGILFGVDAAQTAGVLEIDMQKMNIDYLCIAAHKGLYSPMGTGILISDKPIPKTILEGGTGTDSIIARQPLDMPERFESGTVNVPGIFGIKAGLEFVKQRGVDEIYKKELEMSKKCYMMLSQIGGVILYTDLPEYGRFVPTLSFNLRDYNSMELAEILGEKGVCVRAGLHCCPSAHRRIGTLQKGTVRVSFSSYNKPEEVVTFCNMVRIVAQGKKKSKYFY